MDVLYAFRQRLMQANSAVLQAPLPDVCEEMAQTTRKLRAELGDITRGVRNEHGIAAAVITYRKTGELLTYRDLKYVCFGVASEYGLPAARLIEHDKLFPRLVARVRALTEEPRKFRRCYQGLLKGYFHYPGTRTENTTGRQNWLALRDFLNQHVEGLRKQQPPVEWTEALYEHRHLLADNPCQPYGAALLAGDTAVVEDLKTRLGVDDDTWVMQELILAQVQAATALPDQEFVTHVMRLVKFLEPHRLLLTPGLSMLIRRYAQCRERPEHHTLREVALREWKSPWLDVHKPLWHAQVGEEATAMVSFWLKQRSIRDFFELLQADGEADRQRMEFWLQYAEAMDEIWLALGQNSLYNNKADYARIRRQMEGRYMALEGANYHQDNAFLMKIDGYVFIEFGKKNNACHVFSANNLPFRFGQKSVLGTREGLKNENHPGHRQTLRHTDRWQRDFSSFLRTYAHAAPNEPSNKKSTSSTKPHPIKTSSAVTASSPSKASAKAESVTRPASPRESGLDFRHLQAFCATHGLTVEDHRPHGGALWVRALHVSDSVKTVLQSAGFRFKEGKGWWLA